MDIRSLKQFLQIAKDNNFTKAAASLYLSQPTLTISMKKLEDELGVSLFVRNGQSIQLTEYGEQLVTIATPIVHDFEQIPLWLHDNVRADSGTVVVSITPMIATLYIVSMLPTFFKLYPDIEIRIADDGSFNVLENVLSSKCDVGLCMFNDTIADNPLIDHRPLFTSDVVALISKSNPLSKKSSIKIKDLRQERLNVYSSAHAINQEILNRCNRAGFSPIINFTSKNALLLARLTNTGNGITIIPAPFLSAFQFDNCCAIPFSPVFPWKCCLITRHNRYITRAAETFIDFVTAEFHKILPE